MNLNDAAEWGAGIIFLVGLLLFISVLAWVIVNPANHEPESTLNPDIVFNYDCRTNYNYAFHMCENKYENLTGYYCNGTLICENNYHLKV